MKFHLDRVEGTGFPSGRESVKSSVLLEDHFPESLEVVLTGAQYLEGRE